MVGEATCGQDAMMRGGVSSVKMGRENGRPEWRVQGRGARWVGLCFQAGKSSREFRDCLVGKSGGHDAGQAPPQQQRVMRSRVNVRS